MHTHIWGPYTYLHLHAACPNYNTGNDHRPTRIKPPLLYTTLHCCAQYVTNAVPIKSFHFCASTRRCMKGRGAGRGWTAAYGREEVWQVFLLRKGFNVSMHASSSICGLQELAALAMRQRTLGNGAGAAAEGGVCIAIDFTHVKPLHQHAKGYPSPDNRDRARVQPHKSDFH